MFSCPPGPPKTSDFSLKVNKAIYGVKESSNDEKWMETHLLWEIEALSVRNRMLFRPPDTENLDGEVGIE
jgi:hypothetical protein